MSTGVLDYADEIPSYHSIKRRKLDIVTEEVALALDRTKTSSRNATRILAATVIGLGHDITHVNLSHSTVHRTRMKIREKLAAQLKKNLQLAPALVLHFDGKLLPTWRKSKKVERLPVVVSGSGCNQLLGVPKIIDGRASHQAVKILEVLDEWNVGDRIQAMCFDTTALNTGIF